jgi:hypothetical protein
MTELEFFRKLFSLSGFGFWRLQGRQAEEPVWQLNFEQASG